MEEQLIYTKYYLVCYDKYNQISYQLDFMALNQYGYEIPFINIYSFKNNSKNHRHFIITPDSKLEVAHYEYKNNWQDKNKNIPKIELFYPPKFFKDLGNIFNNNHSILTYLKQRKIVECNINIEREYINLIQNAVNNYFQSQCHSIWDLFTIINDKNDSIPLSRKVKKKKR